MENLIAKYTDLIYENKIELTHIGGEIERQYIIERINLYKEFLADLEAKHRNCSCRTGLKWNKAEHDELLSDQEKLFEGVNP